ncbi:MAG: adenine deaminase [Mangrovibacterium sp.]
MKQSKKNIAGNIVDIPSRKIIQGSIEVENGVIVAVNQHSTTEKGYIIPVFVDAHMHIESSMLTPQNFGELVIRSGTLSVVTDPHEIANVMGVNGVEFMLSNSKKSPIKTFFTIPSCVPATPFDVSGGILTADDVENLASTGHFVGLSEMMNVPGVLLKDDEVMAKLASAKKYGLPVDGHAPLLRGDELAVYANSGISTDHECVSAEEAQEKIQLGMKILLREGSAARNYEALKSLIKTNPNDVMFCTDDSHPDEIISVGHISKLVVRAIADKFDLFDVLKIASINPINHYKLDMGQLRVGDKADFLVVEDLEAFNVAQVYVDGVEKLATAETEPLVIEGMNNFDHSGIEVSSLRKAVLGSIETILLIKGELITTVGSYSPKQATENLESDPNEDLMKIVYINRYHNAAPQVAFCQGFNLKKGAVASSISHDSHNIIAVGCSDKELARAINAVIAQKGGLSACIDERTEILPLPVGGIISDRKGHEVAASYIDLCEMTHQMGCDIDSPFMTLAFLSLVVIPEIKIGEKGLFSYSLFDWMK